MFVGAASEVDELDGEGITESDEMVLALAISDALDEPIGEGEIVTVTSGTLGELQEAAGVLLETDVKKSVPAELGTTLDEATGTVSESVEETDVVPRGAVDI